MRAATAVLVVSLFLVRGAAADSDHEPARRAYEKGEIVSLARILDAVERQFGGQVVEVELEREAKRWVYEVEVLASDGRMLKLTYDAATTKLIESEGEAGRRKRKAP